MSGDAAVQQIVAGFMDAWNRHDAPAFAALFAPDADLTNVYGSTTAEWVTANPDLYATNGLVSDFVEKEFGLNPNSVDSAGSHMLDTWNLTFELGTDWTYPDNSNSSFEIWNESTSYNPFVKGLIYSPGQTAGQSLKESGSPIAQNLPNITAGPKSSEDGSPWAAEVLWPESDLPTFVNLPGVRNAGWLRAIEGTWKGLPTLTIEGKLSWGADPLAASTPGDGIADGARLDPLYDVGLEFHSVDANQSDLGTGTGYAVGIGESYESDSGAGRHVSNYSSQGLVGSATIPTVSNYVTTLPVTQTQRTQTVSLEVVANESGGLTAVPVNGSQTEVSVSYDLVKGTPLTVRVSGSGSVGRSTLFGVLQEVPMGTKAPTWLWVPTDNGTVNGLPVGLQRYTGEQSFDLVVVNVSSSVTSDAIPLPWGGTAGGMTLSAGMNDILVPREQFLYSPLGQAIFLGKSTRYNASNGAPPLVGSSEQGYLTGFDGANLMVDLGAYWQNRAIDTNDGTITPSTESGTPSGNPLEVQVMAATSATDANTGGLPSDPALYSTVGDPSALQSIVTLNVTSTATLDLLLAGLFDNTTGGPNAVNGTFESMTYQVGFLGLNPTVVNAIPNATEPSDGLYGAPASHFPPPPPPSGWGAFWNAVTSFVTNPLGTVLSLVDTVWNAATAAFTYLNHLAHEAVAIGAEIVARTAAAIVYVGQDIANALNAFLNWLWQEIAGFFKSAIEGLAGAFKAAKAAWVSENLAAANETVAGMDGTGGALSHAQSELQAVLVNPLALEIAVTVAVSVVVYVALPFEIGPGTLVSFLVPIIVSALGATLSLGGGGGLLGTAGQFLDGGIGSTFAWLESASEWIWNSTHPSLSSSAVTSFLAPSVPGDHWTFVALLLGGIGLIASQITVSLLGAASNGNSFARLALTEAAAGSAILAVLLVISEWLLSIWAPSGLAATVAEGALDVGALMLGAFSILFGAEAESPTKSAGVAIPAPADILGGIGIIAGIGAEAAGGYDLYSLSQGG